MNLANKLFQTAVLLVCAPFLMAWSALAVSLASLAAIAQSVLKVWK